MARYQVRGYVEQTRVLYFRYAVCSSVHYLALLTRDTRHYCPVVKYYLVSFSLFLPLPPYLHPFFTLETSAGETQSRLRHRGHPFGLPREHHDAHPGVPLSNYPYRARTSLPHARTSRTGRTPRYLDSLPRSHPCTHLLWLSPSFHLNV